MPFFLLSIQTSHFVYNFTFCLWIYIRRFIEPYLISIYVHFVALKMGLPPDSASLIMLEIGKELRFYEDTLALIGLLYAGKLATSFSLSLYRGFREHILTKLYPNKETVTSFGSWAGKTSFNSRSTFFRIRFWLVDSFSVVTGATGGVGKAFAEELARRGLNIVLLDADLGKLNEVSAEIGWFSILFSYYSMTKFTYLTNPFSWEKCLP